MNAVRPMLLAAAVLACGACANHPVVQRRAHDSPQTRDVASGPPPDSRSPGEPSVDGGSVADLYADDVVRDPWERYNRRIHGFNNMVDRYVLRPVAIGYGKLMPDAAQSGVSRFFGNLDLPATAVNQTLQGRPLQALQSLGRFAVNSTVGIGGIFDPATRFGMPNHEEDFGQTLAAWGWRDSRYLVMPLLGPRTLRDSLALVADRALSPASYVEDSRTATSLQLLKIVDIRARLLPMDQARREAYDEYALVRDTWAQRRRHQIEQDQPGGGD